MTFDFYTQNGLPHSPPDKKSSVVVIKLVADEGQRNGFRKEQFPIWRTLRDAAPLVGVQTTVRLDNADTMQVTQTID